MLKSYKAKEPWLFWHFELALSTPLGDDLMYIASKCFFPVGFFYEKFSSQLVSVAEKQTYFGSDYLCSARDHDRRFWPESSFRWSYPSKF